MVSPNISIPIRTRRLAAESCSILHCQFFQGLKPHKSAASVNIPASSFIT
jgi:hypothetical protein